MSRARAWPPRHRPSPGAVVLLAAAPLHGLLPSAWHALWTAAVIVVGIGSIHVGLRRHTGPGLHGWHRFAAGLTWYAAGDLGYLLVTALAGPDHPAGTGAWLVGLLGVPVAVDGVRRQVSTGRRRLDAEAMLDAGVVAAGVGFLGWYLVAAPHMAERGWVSAGTGGAMVFWLSTITVLGLILSRGLGNGPGTPSLWLFAGAVPLAGLSSVAYWTAERGVAWESAPTARVMMALAYALAAAAFWHPSLPTMMRARPTRARSPVRLLVVAGGLTVLPAWHGAMAIGLLDQRPADVVGSGLGFAVTALAVARLHQTLQTRDTAQRALVRREARFRSLVQHAYDGVVVVDADFRLLWGNAKSGSITGRHASQHIGEDAMAEVHPEDAVAVRQALDRCTGAPSARVEARCRLLDQEGRTRWIDLTMVNQLHNPAVGGVVLNYRDVTEGVHAREQLVHQATHDSLTGLANRAWLTAHVEARIAAAPDGSMAMLLVDLDRFKVVNDSLGHQVGDGLLVSVGRRLEEVVGGDGVVARYGGDEFVVVVPDAGAQAPVMEMAGRICRALSVPVVVDGHALPCTASVGVTFRQPPQDADDMLRDADTAMYQAKARGRDGFVVFDQASREAAEQRMHLEAWLRRALATGVLELHYQPIVSLASGAVVGVEALLRWPAEHAPGGHVAVEAAEVIGVAEESGLIVPLGEWALARACADLAALDRALPGTALTMAVNVSGEQLRRPGFTARVAQALGVHGVAADRLVLELTESVLVDDGTAASATLEVLHGMGVRLAMDDFGTGYSALTNLKRIPLSHVKVDRSFVVGLLDHPDDEAIVRAITGMAHALGLTVVAEGVEAHGHQQVLRRLGCDQAQGFHLGAPMARLPLQAWLTDIGPGPDVPPGRPLRSAA